MIDSETLSDETANPLVSIAFPPGEQGRIDDLLSRYDALLSQAEQLGNQMENLLREWKPMQAGESSRP